MRKTTLLTITIITLIVTTITCSFHLRAQSTFISGNIFQTEYFIENHGQFDQFADNRLSVQFGVENAGDYFYFNSGGFVCHIVTRGVKDGDINDEPEKTQKIIEGDIRMHWLNANPNVTIKPEGRSPHYFTFGAASYTSYGYKHITYSNLYPGIDIQYVIPAKGGIKYSLIVHPGADLSKVQFEYSGLNAKVLSGNNQITITNDLLNINESKIIAYSENNEPVTCHYTLNKNVIGFNASLSPAKTTIIDPWIKLMTSFKDTIRNAGANIGCDVDYDYAGNLYVYGGSTDIGNPLLAKYSKAGDLLWTFMGYIASSTVWKSAGSGYIGNFVVDKSQNKEYLGQGFTGTGNRVVRLDSSGKWDSFITKFEPDFNEIWEMNFNCKSGQVIAMGGGTSSSFNCGIVDKTIDTFPHGNFTGATSLAQDIVNSAFDPKGNLYVILAASFNSKVNNHIYRLNNTCTGFTWDTVSGYNSLKEIANKPFIGLSNGYNALAVNSKYLFYYDGKYIKAFRNRNGSPFNNPDSVPWYTLKMQGGIIADECNNIYIGGDSGNIKVFIFDSTKGFTAKADINLAGMAGRHIHDMRYFPGNGLIYVTGDSLVATVKPSIICTGSSGFCTTSEVVDVVETTTALSVYPNPAKDNVTLKFSNEMAHLNQVSVYDITGRRVYEYINTSNFIPSNPFTINTSSFSNGMYLIRVSNEKGISLTQKLIISK